ncbi:MAG TPA: hypothetical protein VEZ42_12005 [Pseudonocardia sp.]|nr:hypothetical protein [Pseudonocardia sp.]
MSAPIEIETLRSVAGTDHCPDGRVCPSIHRVARRPDRRYIVVKRLDDAEEAAAFAPLVGADDLVGWVPAELLPDV